MLTHTPVGELPWVSLLCIMYGHALCFPVVTQFLPCCPSFSFLRHPDVPFSYYCTFLLFSCILQARCQGLGAGLRQVVPTQPQGMESRLSGICKFLCIALTCWCSSRSIGRRLSLLVETLRNGRWDAEHPHPYTGTALESLA